MKRVKGEDFHGRDQLFERIQAGAVHVEGGLWTAAWRELIENKVSAKEAEAFFDKVQAIQHPKGSTVFKVALRAIQWDRTLTGRRSPRGSG